MGQYLEMSKNFVKRKRLPKSLLPLKRKGFLKAFFSLAEAKILLKSTGSIVKDSNKTNEIFHR
jgi:hypothetical protein